MLHDEALIAITTVQEIIAKHKIDKEHLANLKKHLDCVSSTISLQLSDNDKTSVVTLENPKVKIKVSSAKPNLINLSEEEYLFLKELHDKEKFIDVDKLSNKISAKRSVNCNNLLGKIRSFLRDNGNLTINIQDKKTRKNDSMYKLRDVDRPAVRKILSDPIYNSYSAYYDYTLHLNTINDLEVLIKDAIPNCKTIKKVLDTTGTYSSGPMYSYVKSIMKKYNLQLGTNIHSLSVFGS